MSENISNMKQNAENIYLANDYVLKEIRIRENSQWNEVMPSL